jgi:hypothetical protein
MFRRTQLILLGAGLATALAACHPSTPTTSVSTLSYQGQSSHSPTVPACGPSPCTPSSQVAPRQAGYPDAYPEKGTPDDPLRELDIP